MEENILSIHVQCKELVQTDKKMSNNPKESEKDKLGIYIITNHKWPKELQSLSTIRVYKTVNLKISTFYLATRKHNFSYNVGHMHYLYF